MIAIDRGDEPESLARARDQQLALAELDGRPRQAADFVGYDLPEIRDQLLRKQDYRCAFCERLVEELVDPLEHMRPKGGSEDVDWNAWTAPDDLRLFFDAFSEKPFRRESRVRWKEIDNTRYWWLTWTWENLLYACGPCNTGFKGNRFPMERESLLLDEHDQLPGRERPLLVDPAREDPLDHLRFGPDLANPADPLGDNWGPVALTVRGRWTIAVLGLDRRPGLRESWRRVARSVVGDLEFGAARDAIARRVFDEARAHWDRARARLLSTTPAQDFLALRWCVFDHYVPESVRALATPVLELPRPRVVIPRIPRPVRDPRPELASFTPDLQRRVRAMGGRARDRQQMESLLLALCAERPNTTAMLAEILRRADVSALEREYLAPLAAGSARRLVKDPANGEWSIISTATISEEP